MASQDDIAKMIRVEVEIERGQEPEFRQMLAELVLGTRPRSAAIAEEIDQISELAGDALDTIFEALSRDPASGRAPGPRLSRRLVRFLAAVFEPTRFLLDVSELRAMDPVLSRACIDCLNYFRLGLRELPELRPHTRNQLPTLLEKYGVRPGSEAQCTT
jgi:hypothetical protein